MRLKSVLVAIFFIGNSILTLPLILVKINQKNNLPVYDSHALNILGLLLILIGLTIMLPCMISFFTSGKGTPVPVEPPKKLVVSGLYKYVRNPMYIGDIFFLFGGAFILGHLIVLFYPFVFALGLHLFIVFVEEPSLKKSFGSQYRKYIESVPRWIPRLKY